MLEIGNLNDTDYYRWPILVIYFCCSNRFHCRIQLTVGIAEFLYHRTVQTPKFPNTRVLKFLDTRLPEHPRSLKLQNSQNSQILELPYFQIHVHSTFRTPELSDSRTSEHSSRSNFEISRGDFVKLLLR